jgi:hypothetical protein
MQTVRNFWINASIRRGSIRRSVRDAKPCGPQRTPPARRQGCARAWCAPPPRAPLRRESGEISDDLRTLARDLATALGTILDSENPSSGDYHAGHAAIARAAELGVTP